jgi:hypothetical protein
MAQNNQEFERLKQKYQPVLNLMQQLQVQVQNINMEGSKLFIRGVAPSAEVKNKIWDQIKLIDATFSDLVCDISVSQQAPARATAGASVSGGQSQRHYTVKPGELFPKSAASSMATPISTRRYSTPIAVSCRIRTRSAPVRSW